MYLIVKQGDVYFVSASKDLLQLLNSTSLLALLKYKSPCKL